MIKGVKGMAEKKAQMGDFIGFSFNGIHSSELGLVRVSDGNRYEKNLFPAISDKTVQVPGRDGFYYFGSSYNTREMTIKVAFDNLEEKEFRKMVEHFKDKKPHFLWFDELPYKEYLVKIKSPPNFKYLCFDEFIEEEKEENNQTIIVKRKARIYKGEGTIIFICYSPYARARAKSLVGAIDKSIVMNNSEQFDSYHNTILNGANSISNIPNIGDFPNLDPRIYNNIWAKSGQEIRKLIGESYLKLWDDDNIQNGIYSLCENLASLILESYLNNESYEYYPDLINYEIFEPLFQSCIDENEDENNQNIISYNKELMISKICKLLLMSLNPIEELLPTLLSFYNFKEWYKSSKIPIEKETINNSNESLIISNCGDIDMNIKILFSFDRNTNSTDDIIISLKNNEDNEDKGFIKIGLKEFKKEIERRDRDDSNYPYSFFYLDSQTRLLRAYDNSDGINQNFTYTEGNWNDERADKSKDVFNNCIKEGDFFKVSADDRKYTIQITGPAQLKDVEYTYLYY